MRIKLHYLSILFFSIIQYNIGNAVTLTNSFEALRNECPTASLSYSSSILCNNSLNILPILKGTGNFEGGFFSTSSSDITINVLTGEITSAKAGKYTITYTLAANQQCSELKVSTEITIKESSIISGAEKVCLGGIITLTASGTAGSNNPWLSSDTNVATVSNDGLIIGISEGITTITYTNNNGCSTTKNITVNGKPTVSGSKTICLGGNTQLTGSGTPASSSPWRSLITSSVTINNEGLATGVGLGTGLISYTNSNGCSVNYQVTVESTQTVDAGTNQTVCVNGIIVLNGTTSSASNSVTWDDENKGGTFSDIHSLTSNYKPAITSGTVTLTLTLAASGSCPEAKDTILITLSTDIPTVEAGVPVTMCAGSKITLNGSSGGSTQSVSWSDNDAGGVFSNPNSLTSTYTASLNSGVITLTLTGKSSKNCPDATDNMAITLNKTPEISGETTLCIGDSFQYFTSENSNLSNPWKSNDPNIFTVTSGGIIKGISQGFSDVTFTATNGCTGTKKIIVEGAINVSVSSDRTTQQIGKPVSFLATISNSLFAEYEWFINNISQGNNNKLFTTSSLKNGDVVKVCVNNGCSENCSSGPIITLGNDDLAWETFSFYPNPVQQELFISYKNTIEKVEIYNLLGQKVLEKEINNVFAKINLDNLSSGNYILKTKANQMEKTSYFIKQ